MKVAVVMVEPERGLNIGFTARAMMNLGFSDLRIVRVNDRLLAPARRYASHASKIVERVGKYHSIEEATSDVDWKVGTTAIRGRSVRNVLRTASNPRDFAQNVSTSVAILLGREGSGLSNEELEMCDLIVTIPTTADYPTMNVSHAATILLYELRMQSQESLPAYKRKPSGQARERLVSHFESLVESAQIPGYKKKLMVRAWQNVLGRAQVSYRETALLLGALRKIMTDQSERRFRATDEHL